MQMQAKPKGKSNFVSIAFNCGPRYNLDSRKGIKNPVYFLHIRKVAWPRQEDCYVSSFKIAVLHAVNFRVWIVNILEIHKFRF